jgi:predicted ATPase
MQTLEILQQPQSPTKLHTLSGLRLEHTNFTRPKPLLLLAYLCIEGKKDKRFLAELFWPGASNHLNSLAKALSQLRQVGVIDNDDTHAWATVNSDVNEFLFALERHDLEAAGVLYQDSFLSGFYLPDWGVELEEWIYTTREFLASRMREVLLELAETSKDINTSTRYAERAYELDATLEPDLIPRLYKFLANTLHAAKLKQEAKDFGISLEQPKTIVSNLPSRGTSFVGRDIERLELGELLSQDDIRLLTIIGQGGVGKTRLATEVARELQESFPDGVVYFPLEALNTPEQVLAALASAFSVQLGKEGCIEQIAKVIGEKQVLLLLDNVEHLLGQAHIAATLLRECPNLKILVTSRMRLNLEEEWLYTLEGFALPERTVRLEQAQHHDAVALFVQRARKLKPGFTLNDECLPSVLAICERVQGLPLGIELAASWIKTLSCQEIVEQLDKIDFLITSTSNVPERHQSLRNVFEGSWKLLSQEEQKVLSKLSVFRGGFTRDAAKEVTGASLMMLARLVDKSLLRVAGSRYDQHPLLRAFAEEKSGECPDERTLTHIAYANYFLVLAERAAPHLKTSEQTVWLPRLEQDLGNLRAAFKWLIASQKTEVDALRLFNALARFWTTSHYISEGRQWAQEAMARESSEVSSHHATLFHQTGTFAWLQGDYEEAHQHFQRALQQWEDLGDKRGKARTLGNLANLVTEEGNYEIAELYYTQNLRLFRELDDSLGIANALNNSGILQAQQGYFDEAISRYREALERFRHLGDRHGIAAVLNSLGTIARDREEYDLARLYAQESLELQRASGYKVGESIALNTLGVAALGQGDLAKARECFRESVELQLDSASKPGVISSLEHFAVLALAEGEPDKAVRLCAAAHVMREVTHFPLPPRSQGRYNLMLQEARSILGEAGFTTSWTLGSALQLEQAVRLALEERSKNS